VDFLESPVHIGHPTLDEGGRRDIYVAASRMVVVVVISWGAANGEDIMKDIRHLASEAGCRQGWSVGDLFFNPVLVRLQPYSRFSPAEEVLYSTRRHLSLDMNLLKIPENSSVAWLAAETLSLLSKTISAHFEFSTAFVHFVMRAYGSRGRWLAGHALFGGEKTLLFMRGPRKDVGVEVGMNEWYRYRWEKSFA
jgi:hypothetical protein